MTTTVARWPGGPVTQWPSKQAAGGRTLEAGSWKDRVTSPLGLRGFTLVEVVVSSMIGAVVVGGTMAAFVAAGRMIRQSDTMAVAEATGFAEQTLERLRNMIACDSAWFQAPCDPNLPAGQVADPLVRADGTPYTGGTDSILQTGPVRRCYVVTPACDGECFKVDVKVCWGDLTTCTCPA